MNKSIQYSQQTKLKHCNLKFVMFHSTKAYTFTDNTLLDNTLNKLVHEKLLILGKSQAYLFYTVYLH